MPGNFFNGFLALGTGGPSSFTELSGTGYARQAITFGPMSGGRATSQRSWIFTNSGGSAWAVTQLGLFDASANLLLWWNVPVGFQIAAGTSWSPPSVSPLELAIPDAVTAPQAASLVFSTAVVIGTVRHTDINALANLVCGIRVQISGGQISVF